MLLHPRIGLVGVNRVMQSTVFFLMGSDCYTAVFVTAGRLGVRIVVWVPPEIALQHYREFANAALKECMHDGMPVGVMRRVDARHGQVWYEVLGLARPVRWYGGYFILESVNSPATAQVDALTDVLAADSEAAQDQAPGDVPANDYDARLRVQSRSRNAAARPSSGRPSYAPTAAGVPSPDVMPSKPWRPPTSSRTAVPSPMSSATAYRYVPTSTLCTTST